jgi:vacuolar protein-sorting-associated protein 4
MDRAEKLKTWLADDGSNKKKPSAMGANGKASGGGGKKCVTPFQPHNAA